MSKKKKSSAKDGRNKKNNKATTKKAAKVTRPVVKAPDDLIPNKDFWLNSQWHILVIFLVSCGLYINTLGHQYAVDDSIVILRNQYTKKGWAGMKGIWGEDTFTGFFGGKRNLVAGGRYRPFSVATFALELQFFGTVTKDQAGTPVLDKEGDLIYQGNPRVSHIINMLLYGLLCVILYLLLLQLFNPKRDPKHLKSYFIAFTGALLYATHPIHTEAIANIKGRDEILVLLGGLLCTYWVLKAAQKNNPIKVAHFIGAILAFGMSIFSKESAITFLAVIPAALYLFTKKDNTYIAGVTAGFVLLALFFWFGIRAQILGDAGSVIAATSNNAPMAELMNDPFLKIEGNRYVPYTTSEHYGTVFYTWGEYIKLLIYPHPLTNDYYPKHIRTDLDVIPDFSHPQTMLSVLFHLMLGFLLFIGLVRKKAYAFFLLFYFATFSVVSNLLFPIGTNMAERFMFLPSVGFSGLCAMGLYHLIERARAAGKTWAGSMRMPLILLGVVVLAYSAKTIVRNQAWYDDYTLFTTDIAYSPHSAKLNNAVSGVLQSRALRDTDLRVREDKVQQALKHSKTAVQLHPTYNNAWLLRGNANVMLGNISQETGKNNPATASTAFPNSLNYYNEAIKSYTEVLRLRPNHPDVNRNFAVVYRDRGKLLGQFMGQVDQSIASLNKSLEYQEGDMEVWRLLGVAQGIKANQIQQQGRLEEALVLHQQALSTFNKGLAINPNFVPILYNAEIAYKILGNETKAQELNQRWKAIDPTYNPRDTN
ncbi:MAG: tetratricopeptide repeat protein [Aureispira sp.]